MNTRKSPQVRFNFADKRTNIPSSILLKTFLVELFQKENTPLERIRYVFCSDNYLLDINRQHLNHDYLTDIITFPLSGKNEAIEAEVYISVDRVKDNAKQFNVPFTQEILRVVFHGALHLCGFKDKTKKEQKEMRDKEDYYLNLWYS